MVARNHEGARDIVMSVPIAVIGAGIIGARHARLAAAEPECRLLGLADPTPAAAELAAELGVAHYASAQALLEKESPEGVVIAAPNALHLPIGRMCAERGIHLLVEKPVAESVAAGRQLVEAAEAAGVAMMVGHHRRFDPALDAAKQIVADEIGDLVAVSAMWSALKPDPYYDVAWRREAGGGPVLINMIHDINALQHICGQIASVYAETVPSRRGHPVEDTAAVVLRFAGGAIGTIMLTDAAPSPWGWEAGTNDNPGIAASGQNCYRFVGTTGALDFPNLTLWRHDGEIPGGWQLPYTSEARPTGERDSLTWQLRHFCRVVRGEEEPRVSGREGLATLAATMAVHESASSGRPVSLES